MISNIDPIHVFVVCMYNNGLDLIFGGNFCGCGWLTTSWRMETDSAQVSTRSE